MEIWADFVQINFISIKIKPKMCKERILEQHLYIKSYKRSKYNFENADLAFATWGDIVLFKNKNLWEY